MLFPVITRNCPFFSKQLCHHSRIQLNCSYKQLIDVHPNVQRALNAGRPVVALESTIITHGMPYPKNLDTAYAVEEIIEKKGATSATIAIVDGRIKIGLTLNHLLKLAKSQSSFKSNNDSSVIKCSRRDLPYVISRKLSGGTTVSATMLLAHMKGIRIFATGGIGGVHRNGHITLDISSDLMELGKTPVVVVSSGMKSILDISKSLEYLETQGVCVATYGNEQSYFPDFYTCESECKTPYNVNDAHDAAQLILALEKLQLQSGILLAVPIPRNYEADKTFLNNAINKACKEVELKGITGKDVTPFLLATVAKITEGDSLEANIALIKNNASVAGEIACELSCLKNMNRSIYTGSIKSQYDLKKKYPLVIGATMLDFSLIQVDDTPLAFDGNTYPVKIKQSGGGVGRNLAECLCKLYGPTNFISVIGNDKLGKILLDITTETLRNGIFITDTYPTATCSTLFNKNGDNKISIASMEILECLNPNLIRQCSSAFNEAALIIFDANLTLPTMEIILQKACEKNKVVFFEPTDGLKASKPFKLSSCLTQTIRFISPNVTELKSIAEILTGQNIENNLNLIDISRDKLLLECKNLLYLIKDYFDCIVVTLGSHGVLVTLRHNDFMSPLFDVNCEHNYIFTTLSSNTIPKSQCYTMRFYPAPKVNNIVNVSGAGDCFSSGFITGLLRGLSVDYSVALGFVAAEKAIKSEEPFPKHFFNLHDEKRLLQNAIISLNFYDI